MGILIVLFFVLFFFLSCKEEEINIKEFYVENSCTEEFYEVVVKAEGIINKEIGRELFGKDILRVMGWIEDKDGFNQEDFTDRTDIIYCPQKGDEIFDLYPKKKPSGEGVKEDVMVFYDFLRKNHNYSLFSCRSNLILDKEDKEEKKVSKSCRKNLNFFTVVLLHEISHSFGIGHVFGSQNIMTEDVEELTKTPSFTPIDKSAWCCSYNCTNTDEYKCSWDAYKEL